MKPAIDWYKENYTSGEWSNWWNISLSQIKEIQKDARQSTLRELRKKQKLIKSKLKD